MKNGVLPQELNILLPKTREDFVYKKILTLVLTLIIAVLLMGSAPTDETIQNPPDPSPGNRALIINDKTGQIYDLPVIKKWVKELGGGVYEAMYYVEIPEAIFLGHSPNSIASRSVFPKGSMDPTRSVVVYLSKNYSCAYMGGTQYEKVYKNIGFWERLDPTVSCTYLRVKSWCWGDYYSGGFCNGYDSTGYGNPSQWVAYSDIPYWYTKWVSVNYFSSQKGGTTVTLKRGVSTWTFTAYIYSQCY